jgi:hypothetical protein
MAKKNIFREIFSGTNNKLSAKRVVGGLSMFIALGCIVYLTIKDGSNAIVENLLITVLIMGASLLGLPAITGIWGNNKVSVGDVKDEPIKEEKEESPKESE